MKMAILFWFYKDLPVCINRLEILRKYNPDILIYGLYGGNPKEEERYKSALGEKLNDFYTFNHEKDPIWKWLSGDLLLTAWYRERGKDLDWDTVVVVQWDMLVFGSVHKLFPNLQKDQLLISGLRPIKEVEHIWTFTDPIKRPDLRQQYLDFLEHVTQKYDYNQEPLCCMFIVGCLPRSFLAKYASVEEPELGYWEYRIPIYAQIFGNSFCTDHEFNVWWPGDASTNKYRKVINGKRLDISLISVLSNLAQDKGFKIFHPYRKVFPLTRGNWFMASNIIIQDIFGWLYETARQIKHSKLYLRTRVNS